MFDFGSNLDQAMQIILAYTGRVRFYGVSITEMIFTVIALPWGIWIIQRIFKTFSPVTLDFDPVTGSQYDPDWHDQRDAQALDNYLSGVHDPESAGVISRARGRQSRKNVIYGRRR